MREREKKKVGGAGNGQEKTERRNMSYLGITARHGKTFIKRR